MSLPRPLSAFAAAALAAALLTGCASAHPEPTDTADAAAQPTTPADTDTDATPEPQNTTASATCETIISEDTLSTLNAQGWSARESALEAGGITLDEGLQCMWTDYENPTGDLMIFGWAPITAEEAREMQDGLVAEGWLRQEEGDVLYITEDPEQALTVDENGDGMTYAFGDGWVTVADVKQGLLLIHRPGA